ncbi:hypothetical protein T484DRAFT_1977295 [Baffinella frigidus]|nr:hypothetical protein T484DRAFT_1977295 [Cryptophyta sp. CCMP2293]
MTRCAMTRAIRISLSVLFLAMFADAAMPVHVYHEELSASPPRGRTLQSLSHPHHYPSPVPPPSRRFELAGVEKGDAPESAATASVLGGEAYAQPTLRRRSLSSARVIRSPSAELDDTSDFSSIDV